MITKLFFAIIASSTVLMLAGCSAKSNDCDNCVQLQILTENHSYERDEPIIVKVSLTVINDNQITFANENTPLKNFDIELIDEQNVLVPLTNEGVEAKYSSGFRVIDILTHGQKFEQTFSINSWFDLSEPGAYVLLIRKRVWSEDVAIDLVSNSVAFTLSP